MSLRIAKPYECTCCYPTVIARSGSGHDLDCPVHERWESAVNWQRPEEAAEQAVANACGHVCIGAAFRGRTAKHPASEASLR